MTRRELIMDTLDDLVSNLLYYDRKEDEELPVGAIEEALAAGEVTVADLVAHFEDKLQEELHKPVWSPE